MNATYDWKAITTVKGMREPFVDWYRGTREQAMAAWQRDCADNGVPLDRATVVLLPTEPTGR